VTDAPLAHSAKPEEHQRQRRQPAVAVPGALDGQGLRTRGARRSPAIARLVATPGHLTDLQRTVGNRATGRFLAGKDGAAEKPAVPVQREFTSPQNLDDHYDRHNDDFNFGSKAEYSASADTHYANRGKFKTKVSDGKTYVYDAATDTIGTYTSKGKTITFFKPCHNQDWKVKRGDGQAYFDKQ
jgi:hypothetical protein